MKPAGPADFPRFEADMIELWEQEKTFEQSLENRKTAPRFSFYDGPPFANGLPHYGHVVAVTEKDAMTRYKTMRGYYVPRRNGWDTHGLPVEYEVEKDLGITTKRQIEDDIAAFNAACRASVFKYKAEWEEFFRRIGRWADNESYATLDQDYIESVWWVFKSLDEKGLVYLGFKSMPYCPRCATPLSNFEVNQGYRDDVPDPSLYVLFPLVRDPETAFLAWTTTPWTLPANAALAVRPESEYVTVELINNTEWPKIKRLILAKDRLDVLDLRQHDYEVVKTQKGEELAGERYRPLYPPDDIGAEAEATHRVYDADVVSLDDGTGVLHVAPAYGEDDLNLGREHKLAMIQSVDAYGKMTDVAGGKFSGLFFKEADPKIIADLAERGRVFAAETFTHTYPFCWRCDTPLLYYATPSWFVAVSKLTDKLLANNQKINWSPEHIKAGRFGKWLAEARDWSVSRNRFWGAPIPVWQCDGHYIVVGSVEELKKLAVDPAKVTDLHRPAIDEVAIKCPEHGEAKRVSEVLDCWFESGSMPYAEDHYPFENQQNFKVKFPADFIAEGLDQTRGWFYTLHVLATALFDQPAFQNVIVNGTVLAADGRKLSKRLKNYPPVEEVFNNFGADVLRFFLMSSPVENGEDVRFGEDALKDIQRNFFLTLWNVYSFLTTYAADWRPPKDLVQPASDNLLDQWILARLNQTIEEMTMQADDYKIARATRPLIDLVDDLSNWYLRRSRRRFSRNDDAQDRAAATATLHYVLVRVMQLLAPWAPFLSDKVYRGLTAGMALPGSVHLTDWPAAGEVDSDLLEKMTRARAVVQEGLAQRAAAKIKVRQPLASLKGPELDPQLVFVIKEEVNVKNYDSAKAVMLDTKITQDLKQEGLARDIIRLVQAKRKEAGLAVDDRIKLELVARGELAKAIENQRQLIETETLAELASASETNVGVPVLVEGQELGIRLEKHGA